MERGIRQCILLVTLLFGAVGAGCNWSFKEPPTAGGRMGSDGLGEKPVVVIGRFANPARARVQWSDIGSGMSEALAARLRNESRYDAWVDAPLAAQVGKVLTQVGDRRRRGLEKLRKEHREVQFVVTGRVTDFAHSTDLPESLRRQGIFGRKNEAVVAIQLDIIDLTLGRVVASDHIYGTASAKGATPKEIYADMAFGSYLFWSTPLGRASDKAIGRAIKEFDETLVYARPVRPPDDETEGPRRIARQTGPRTVQLVAEADPRSEAGRLYFVCEVDAATGEHHAVFDPETGYPLKARIERPQLALTTRTALLLGRKPPTVDLRGAVLCPVAPESYAQGR